MSNQVRVYCANCGRKYRISKFRADEKLECTACGYRGRFGDSPPASRDETPTGGHEPVRERAPARRSYRSGARDRADAEAGGSFEAWLNADRYARQADSSAAGLLYLTLIPAIVLIGAGAVAFGLGVRDSEWIGILAGLNGVFMGGALVFWVILVRCFARLFCRAVYLLFEIKRANTGTETGTETPRYRQ